MSYYNHMHDEKDNIAKCDNCQKKFAWYEYGPLYEGGTDTEIIECPYCKKFIQLLDQMDLFPLGKLVKMMNKKSKRASQS